MADVPRDCQGGKPKVETEKNSIKCNAEGRLAIHTSSGGGKKWSDFKVRANGFLDRMDAVKEKEGNQGCTKNFCSKQLGCWICHQLRTGRLQLTLI